MGWQDREYHRSGGGGGFGGGGMRFGLGGGGITVMVKWLLIINVVVFVLDGILTDSSRANALSPFAWGNFNVPEAVWGFQVWRFFTYQFLHAGLLHILCNMIGLYFFGPMLERWWGSKRFLVFYLLCGVSGAMLMLLLAFVPGVLPGGQIASLVGASGSVFGILAGAAVIAPKQTVMLLFPPIPMQLRTMALVFLGIAGLTVLVGGPNAGGQAAHLGGAGLGFLLVKNPRWLDWAGRMSPSAIQAGAQRGAWERKRKKKQVDDLEVDRILAKVRDQGLQSLTKKEKKTLAEATERQKNAG